MAEDYTEKYSYENVMAMALANMPASYRKQKGEIAYDAVAPFANAISNFAISLQYERDQLWPDTADRENLLNHAREQGVEIRPASATISRGVFNVKAQISIGSRFSQGNMNFVVLYQLADENGNLIPGNYAMQSETAGIAGNTHLGSLVPIAPVVGLTSAQLTEVLIPGEDVESTEEILQNVIQSYDSKSYGFNEVQYITVTKSLPGVGGARVKRREEGGSNVNVYILASNNVAPTQELIDSVQEALDPIPYHGEGVGLVPIGHRAIVNGVQNSTVDVSINVALNDGWTWEAIEPYIESTIKDYFLNLASAWDSLGRDETIIVRAALIISRVVMLEGILDVHEVLLNGSQTNVTLAYDEIPILGTLTQII